MTRSPSRRRSPKLRRDIAERLREYIQRYCGGRTSLHKRSGISLSTIAEWLGKQRRVPNAEQLRLLSGLGVNLNWLFVGEGPVLAADLRIPEGHLEGLRARLVNTFKAEFPSTWSERLKAALPSAWTERMIENVVPQPEELFQALLVLYRPWVRQTLSNPVVIPFVEGADASELFGPGPREEVSLNDLALGQGPPGRRQTGGSGPASP